MKRDNIPEKTIKLFYKEFKSRGWSFKKLDEVIYKMKMDTTFKTIKIDDFFRDESLYIQERIAQQVEIKFNNLIEKAEKALNGKDITIEVDVDVPMIAVHGLLAKKIFLYYEIEQNDLLEETISTIIEELITKEIIRPRYQNEERVGIGTRLKKRFNFK